MGEAIWTRIDICGEIGSVDAIHELVAALDKEVDEIEMGGADIAHNPRAIRQGLLDANAVDGQLTIKGYTWNGVTDAIEKVARKHKMGLRVRSSSYGGGAPSVFFIKEGRKSIELSDNGGSVSISLDKIEQLSSRGMKSIDELKDFLGMYGEELPDFSISDDVIRELFIPVRKP